MKQTLHMLLGAITLPLFWTNVAVPAEPSSAPSEPATVPLTEPATAPSGLSLPLAVPPATQSADTEPAGGNNGRLHEVLVTADLDRSRDLIAPPLGARTYTIGPNQIQNIPGGENAPFQQVLLRAPGVVEDSFGQLHVRGEHANLTYRVNGVLLPEGLNGFGQELDTRLIGSVTLIDGSLPAQFGFRTAGIVDVRSGFANTGHQPPYYPVNLGYQHVFEVHDRGLKDIKFRVDIVNVFDQVYALRDGSGIGVGAPQFGQRRGIFAGLTFDF